MRRIAMLCVAAWLSACCAYAEEVVRYPRPESPNDLRGEYALQVLELALREAGSNARLEPSRQTMLQERSLTELESGNQIDVMWTMTTREREQRARPIRIPIEKGLIGWRLALIHASQSDLLMAVQTKEQLAGLVAGQGHDWPDVEILRANGLRVVAAAGYDNLFEMLEQGRFDYMPRSVEEIWSEVQAHRAKGAIVDQHLVIHYPAAVYFFVSNSNPALAETISLGLYRAIENGKFDRLFYSHFAEAIERASISRRQVIELENPSLPVATPLKNGRLWLRFPRSPSVGPATRLRANPA